MFALSDARDYSFSKVPYLEREEETTMKARFGQNQDNRIALQVRFNPTATNIMDMCIFVITKEYFFQRVCNYL